MVLVILEKQFVSQICWNKLRHSLQKDFAQESVEEIVFVELLSVNMRVVAWQIIIVVIAHCLNRWVRRQLNWHTKFEMHGEPFNVLWRQLDVLYLQPPEEE